MGLYLPFSMRKEVLIGAREDLNGVWCGECGGKNVAGVDWCLFCGVLLMGGRREVKSESVEWKIWRKDENDEPYTGNEKEELYMGNEYKDKSKGSKRKDRRESDYMDSENVKQYMLGNGNDKCINISNDGVKHDDVNIIMGGLQIPEDIIYTRDCELKHDIQKIRIFSEVNNNKPTIVDSVKLNLNGNDTPRTNADDEWDFDLEDNKTIDNGGNNRVNVVPPLDLSGVNSWRDVDDAVKVVRESKDNKKKVTRKWETSSTAWVDMPQSVLHKKPSNYYRSKLNSFTNKIDVTVFQSKVVADKDVLMSFIEEVPKFLNDTTKYQPLFLSSYINYNNKDMSQTKENVIVEENRAVYRPPEIIDIKLEDNLDVSLWQCLPAEIWIKIMKHLNHLQLSILQQTCRRIYSIALDSPLWKSINLYRHSTLNNDHIFYIARKKPNELHFKNCFGTYITVEGLKAMFKICGEGLKKISFISCSKGVFEDDLFLVLSASYCPNVTHVNASYLMNLQNETLKTMIEGFTKIESLNIMGAHSISNKSIKFLTEHHRASLINLDLYGCFKLNSMTLKLLEGCLNLQSLALGSISNLKRSALIGMLKKLSQLTILDLRGTTNLVDDSLLKEICLSCPNLQQIILTNSCRLTDDGLIGLAQSCVSKSLNILDICGCSKITEKGLEEVLKYCHELEDLDISCTGIRGNGTKYFEIYSPQKLKCLRINNNKFISKNELVSLVNACKRLSTLYMCGSTSIGSWKCIEEKFPRVTFKHE